MNVRFLSVCSGIEAASVAWAPLGWSAVGFAEIDKAASRVLAHHYGANMPGDPLVRNGIPNFGDFTAIDLDALGPVDLLCGGTPCQAFSVAGKRLSLADARGNLTLAFAVLAHELARSHGLRNAVWENVPGVLATYDNAFGCFLGALVGSEYPVAGCDRPRAGDSNWFWTWSDKERNHRTRWPDFGMVAGPAGRAAWRVLDAQWFGLAQRRRRVFVVADFGNGADPAAVLFERACVRGDSPPRREAREGLAADAEGGAGIGGERYCADVAPTLMAQSYARTKCMEGDEAAWSVAHALRAEGFDAIEDGTGRGTPIVPVAFRTSSNCGAWETGDRVDALTTGTDASATVLAFDATQITSPGNYSSPQIGDPVHPLAAGVHPPAVAFAIQERAVSENLNAGPQGMGVQEGLAYTLEARHHAQSVAFDLRGRDGGAQFEGPHDTAAMRAANGGSSRSYVAQPVPLKEPGDKGDAGARRNSIHGSPGDPMFTLKTGGVHGVFGDNVSPWAVRRLTPRECERLQGFPDDYIAIPDGKGGVQADGPRYKQLGNSWAVPVARWIGARIDALLSGAAHGG